MSMDTMPKMAEQRAMGRANWKGSGDVGHEKICHYNLEDDKTTFTGYTETSHEAKIVALFDQEGQSVETLATAGSVILDRTPFYGESGGQAGDTGSFWVGDTEIAVKDTQKPTQNLIEHPCKPDVALSVGQTVIASIEVNTRLLSRRNHTATHLLHRRCEKFSEIT